MTADPQESLAHLDWRLTCQCTVHQCTAPATHAVQTHALHRCEGDGLTPDGNTVQVLCGGCVNRLRAFVGAELLRQRKAPGRNACETCGAPVVEVGDVVRGVEKL